MVRLSSMSLLSSRCQRPVVGTAAVVVEIVLVVTMMSMMWCHGFVVVQQQPPCQPTSQLQLQLVALGGARCRTRHAWQALQASSSSSSSSSSKPATKKQPEVVVPEFSFHDDNENEEMEMGRLQQQEAPTTKKTMQTKRKNFGQENSPSDKNVEYLSMAAAAAEEEDVEDVETIADYEEDDDDEEEDEDVTELQPATAKTTRTPFFCAVPAGSVVQIQVGDVRLARKAWKKRRRRASPLLVPCSILSMVDLKSALQGNCIYLLQKFGTAAAGSAASGISLPLTELLQRHATHLKCSLHHLAPVMGYDTASEMVLDLFQSSSLQNTDQQQQRDKAQDTHPNGISVFRSSGSSNDNSKNNHNDFYLYAPISRLKAQKRAMQSAILQFALVVGDDNAEPGSIQLQHTGLVRNRKPKTTTTRPAASAAASNEQSADTAVPAAAVPNNLYRIQPLSAALRVQSMSELGSSSDEPPAEHDSQLQTGTVYDAVVMDYDLTADAGSPLLTVTLQPSSRRKSQKQQPRDHAKPSSTQNVASSSTTSSKQRRQQKSLTVDPDICNPAHVLTDLHVGDGPLQGQVIRLIKGGALVDARVGRPRKQQEPQADVEEESSGATTTTTTTAMRRVLAFLPFSEAVLSSNNNNLPEASPKQQAAARTRGKDSNQVWDEIFAQQDDDHDNDQEEVAAAIAEVTARLEQADDDEDSDDDDMYDESEDEDITHLCEINEAGELIYKDPDTGEVHILSGMLEEHNHQHGHDHDDDDEEDDDDDDDDEEEAVVTKREPPSNRKTKPAATQHSSLDRQYSKDHGASSSSSYRTKTLRPGDTVQVYVKSVAKQSSQLLVTMNANAVRGKTAKDLKQTQTVNKKLSRLLQQLGGVQRLQELKGLELNGIVKATSNTGGNWLYVQPTTGNKDDDSTLSNLPVGVALLDAEIENQVFAKGDAVRVTVSGIDENRGQLSLRVLRKLSP